MVTEHAPRGRDTSRNSLVPLGASESPRLALGPAVSVPRYLAPHDRAWQAGSLARKVVPGNFTTGLVSSRYLGFGVSQIPRRHRQLAFPPIPTGTPSRLTALARLGSLLRSVRPPGTDFEPNVEPSNGSNALDQHICPLTCASVATERVTRQTTASAGSTDKWSCRDRTPRRSSEIWSARSRSFRTHPRVSLSRAVPANRWALEQPAVDAPTGSR